MLAFLPTIGASEMMILLIIGLLLFGRDLPDVGRKVGKTVAQFRRTLHEFKDQMDRDGTVRDLKNTVDDAVREVKRVAVVPRELVDPATVLRELTDRDSATPVPEATAVANGAVANDDAAPAATSGDQAAGEPNAAEPKAGDSAPPNTPAAPDDKQS